MTEAVRTKEQLISELEEMRQRLAELEALETERKQAEEALRESEQKHRHLFEELNDAVFLADVETGRLLDTNKRGESLLGRTHKDIIGMHQSGLHPPEMANEYHQKFATHVQKGHAADFDGEVITKDGSIVQVNISATPVTVGGKRLILGLFRDITERKRAEEALRDSEEHFRLLIENVADVITVINRDGTLCYVSPSGEKVLGYKPEEVVGGNAFDFLHPDDLAYVMEVYNQAIQIPSYTASIEYRLRHRDGTWRTLEVRGKNLLDNPAVAGIVLVYRDITERKQAEEREKELQQELALSSRLASIGELAAGVAHEINNPLTGIIGFSQRLLRKSASEEISRDLQRIHDEAQRAARVVENLRAFARRREPQKEYLDINEILGRTLELRAYELRTSNIELAVELTPDLPEAIVDFQQLEQVFLNIIMNAEQAMTEANGCGKLTITSQKVGKHVRISFADDGPGISAEHFDKLFDPFFTTRGEKGGTGLGLSVCHGIVTEHGGKIYARSQPGKGATFFVELPLPTKEIN